MTSVLFAAYSFAQIVVPDIKFRNFLTKNYSIQFDSQGGLLTKNDYFIIDTITKLDVGFQNIADLKGIEGFTKLETLVCAGNQLQNLNLSANIKLRRLNFSSNSISAIDLTTNTELRGLSCSYNPIETIDLTHQKNLYDFFCTEVPKLSSINIGKNDSLIDIWVTSSLITNLDVSGCSNLRAIALTDNKLKALDVSKNPLMEYISIKNNEVESIDLTGLVHLTNLELSGNKLTSLDVTKTPNLSMLNCSENQLRNLDVSKCNKLFYLECRSNLLRTLDIANCRNMNMLDITNNMNLTRCFVWTIPFAKNGLTVNANFTPVNFFMAGDKLKGVLESIYSAPTAQKKSVVDSIMATILSFPLIENDTLATYIYRGAEKAVLMTGDAFKWSTTGTPLTNIPETDLWILNQNYENDARLDYKYIADGNWILDSRNKLTCAGGFGNNSELRMPKYIVSPETEYYAEIPHGQLISKTAPSINLNNTRPIKIYLPPSYSFSASDSFPLVLFHDGLEYVSLANANNTLDYLIEHKKIRPIIGVFIPPVDRPNEYRGSLTESFTKFISDELLPMITSQYRILKAPKYRASVGISNGGDISQHLGFKLSDKIGNVGSFSAGGYWYTNEYIAASKLNLKYYIDAGTYDEVGFLDNNQYFVNSVLKPKGYEYQFNIFHEGHSWGNWKAHLHYALEYFFPYSDLAQSVEPISNDIRSNSIGANYPNPFRLTTTIRYNCASTNLVKIVITDAAGRTINTLVNKEMEAGTHEVEFTPTNASNGIYFATIFFGSKKMNTIKMIQIK